MMAKGKHGRTSSSGTRTPSTEELLAQVRAMRVEPVPSQDDFLSAGRVDFSPGTTVAPNPSAGNPDKKGALPDGTGVAVSLTKQLGSSTTFSIGVGRNKTTGPVIVAGFRADF